MRVCFALAVAAAASSSAFAGSVTFTSTLTAATVTVMDGGAGDGDGINNGYINLNSFSLPSNFGYQLSPVSRVTAVNNSGVVFVYANLAATVAGAGGTITVDSSFKIDPVYNNFYFLNSYTRAMLASAQPSDEFTIGYNVTLDTFSNSFTRTITPSESREYYRVQSGGSGIFDPSVTYNLNPVLSFVLGSVGSGMEIRQETLVAAPIPSAAYAGLAMLAGVWAKRRWL